LVIEWEAKGGEVLISTAVNQTPEDETTGATSINGFQYRISFQNIAFNTGNGEQRNDFVNFGTYTLPTLALPSFGETNLKKCTNLNDFFYNFLGTQSLSLKINNDLLTTTLGTKTEDMDGVKNILTYKTYRTTATTALSDDFFCNSTPPVNAPFVDEEYVSIVGGKIEVTTSAVADKFKYVIKLKNVIMKKAGSEVTFKLGFDYKFGEYTTN
jgi:hypothetical protein